MAKKKISEYERFMALSDAEKDAEVAEFENSTDRSRFRPLTPAQRKLWAGIKRRIGRPVVGKGAKPIAVTVERSLLAQVDRFAKKHCLKRSELVAEGLRLVLKQRRAG
jgi:hypothetical protein